MWSQDGGEIMAAGRKKGGAKKKTTYKKPYKKKPGLAPGVVPRVRMPKAGEILGIVTGIMGGGRMQVICNDGKERMGRIPGKLKRRIWVREGDAVAVIPWEIEGDKKGDVVWRYPPNEKRWLAEKGYLKVS